MVLSVSPTLFEMSANPAQTWQSSVRVINANEYDIRIYAEPVNFTSEGEGGHGSLVPLLGQPTDAQTLAEWIAVSDEEILIPAEQTVSIPFTISVPTDATPGGHFAAILIGTRPFGDSSGQAQVETSQVVSSLVFLSVAGDIVETGNIREFVTQNAVYEQADVSFSVRFENTGNVHLQPQGEIEIFNMWGQSRGAVSINKNSQFGNVLPDSIRNYLFEWSREWSIIDIGRNKAVVTLAYGDDVRQFVNETTYFWIIPWKLLLLVVTGLGLFLGLLIWGVRLYVRKMLLLAGVTPELQRQPTVSKKKVSLIAPLEEGMLDLRNELHNGAGSLTQRLAVFAKRYQPFFVVFTALLIFFILTIWYIVLVVRNDFAYDPAYEVVEEKVADNDELVTQAEVTELTVINHSGREDAVRELEIILTDTPYKIVEEVEPYDGEKQNSVLVYDPELSDEMIDLQSYLPGVLVSAYDAPNEDLSTLTLYVGSDLFE